MMTRPLLIALGLALALCLSASGKADPPFKRGGSGGAPAIIGGLPYAGDCAVAPGVCVDHYAGQSFIQWQHPTSGGLADTSVRGRVYESTSPITSSNYTSATLIGSYILPNSGQLYGGDPTSGTCVYYNSYSLAGLQDTRNSMAKVPNARLGGVSKTLGYATDMLVRKAPSARSVYYAVVLTDAANGSPAFLDAAGPVTESVAPQQAIPYVQRTTGYGHITYDGSGNPVGTAGLPIVFNAHGSSSGRLCTPYNASGDYDEWFGDTDEGWQTGLPIVTSVLRDGVSGQSYPSLPGGAIVLAPLNQTWNPQGTSIIETNWIGEGYNLPGTGNRLYRTTQFSIARELQWIVSRYGADLNQIHWNGVSMGAWGGVFSGLHMRSWLDARKPVFSSVMIYEPALRWDLTDYGSHWPGSTWIAGAPFIASIAAAPRTLGSDASAFPIDDGTLLSVYGNTPSYISSVPQSDDLPFFAWLHTKQDPGLSLFGGAAGWKQAVDTVAAFQAGHRGHALAFGIGAHETNSPLFGAINCDGIGVIDGVCYNRSQFRLDRAYPAFDSSSIDENLGTGTQDANGVYDGDDEGLINAGFTWSIAETGSTITAVIGNTWMGRNPTVFPSSTITGSITSASTSMTLSSATGFLATGGLTGSAYFGLGPSGARPTELFLGSLSGTTLSIVYRSILGTTPKSHSAGEVVTQYPAILSGPKRGPFSNMTVNVTFLRMQTFSVADGTVKTCSITPFGGTTSVQTPVVTNNKITLIALPINVGGRTNVSCI